MASVHEGHCQKPACASRSLAWPLSPSWPPARGEPPRACAGAASLSAPARTPPQPSLGQPPHRQHDHVFICAVALQALQANRQGQQHGQQQGCRAWPEHRTGATGTKLCRTTCQPGADTCHAQSGLDRREPICQQHTKSWMMLLRWHAAPVLAVARVRLPPAVRGLVAGLPALESDAGAGADVEGPSACRGSGASM